MERSQDKLNFIKGNRNSLALVLPIAPNRLHMAASAVQAGSRSVLQPHGTPMHRCGCSRVFGLAALIQPLWRCLVLAFSCSAAACVSCELLVGCGPLTAQQLQTVSVADVYCWLLPQLCCDSPGRLGDSCLQGVLWPALALGHTAHRTALGSDGCLELEWLLAA